MEFKARFKEYSRNYIDGSGAVSFKTDDLNPDALNNIVGKDLRITVKQWRGKRSLSANSYYWVLVGKIADALNISKPFCHNMMMRKYGQAEKFNDEIAYTMLPDNDDTTERMCEMEEAHFAPTSIIKIGKNGITYRAWKLLKPSHMFDTYEMSILIDGVVDEAKRLDIETLTPDELEKMKQLWKV